MEVDLRGSMFACPSQSAMFAVSIPACSRLIAQVCRSVWARTFFSASEEHRPTAAAVATGDELADRSPGQWRPGRVGNSGPSGTGGSLLSRALRSWTVFFLEWDHALLTALADAFELAVRADLDAVDAQVGQLLTRESGLDACAAGKAS